jgi:4'-phosphopantetheinyl transferase
VNVYWLEQSEPDVPTGDEWLGSGERADVARLHLPRRRAEWRLGRWTAKRAIAGYLSLSGDDSGLASIEVRPAPSGAPEAFIQGLPAAVNISISHSHGVGFCAAADPALDVGCDVEKVVPHSTTFLSDYFTEAERAFFRNISASDRDTAVTLLWSAKESALKLLRCGLRSDTRCLAVSTLHLEFCHATAWSQLAVECEGGPKLSGWWRQYGGFVWTMLIR